MSTRVTDTSVDYIELRQEPCVTDSECGRGANGCHRLVLTDTANDEEFAIHGTPRQLKLLGNYIAEMQSDLTKE